MALSKTADWAKLLSVYPSVCLFLDSVKIMRYHRSLAPTCMHISPPKTKKRDYVHMLARPNRGDMRSRRQFWPVRAVISDPAKKTPPGSNPTTRPRLVSSSARRPMERRAGVPCLPSQHRWASTGRRCIHPALSCLLPQSTFSSTWFVHIF